MREKEKNVMKLIKVLAVVVVAAFLLTGCLYSNVKTPFDTDLDKTVLGQKEGKATLYSVLWLFSWGDMSVAAAAKNGGITTLNHMDAEAFQILFGLYSKTSIIVYGE
jgi:TRL-like protein family